ncbi:1-phosphofructokinase family hexose kinase [Salinispora arenicola]|uniref:1-phosphofructokinase family hexose kinase n=1 Tax=Salinispora arenicola TaxID=168697 RepID=UPI000360542E|nr:1-phosphofructokinase [Salinispora arenicola]
MIVTLTLNPSLDRTIEIGELIRGDVIRAASARIEPGGKGVNVSRALLANGVPSRALVACGGDEGGQLIRLLRNEQVDVRALPVAGTSRSNITLSEPDGTTTKVNEPGPELSAAEFSAITDQVLAEAGAGGCVVVCGSLPPGLPIQEFFHLCERVVAAGDQLVVDTSGPALQAAAKAGATLVKPNREELAEVVGRPLVSFSDVVDAAQELRSWGAGAVLASLGADGVVLVDATGVIVGAATVSRPRSSVGAGDALLAGFLAAGGAVSIPAARSGGEGASEPTTPQHPHQRALVEAVAWGAAAVSLPGSQMPGPADIHREQVRLHDRLNEVQPLLSPS